MNTSKKWLIGILLVGISLFFLSRLNANLQKGDLVGIPEKETKIDLAPTQLLIKRNLDNSRFLRVRVENKGEAISKETKLVFKTFREGVWQNASEIMVNSLEPKGIATVQFVVSAEKQGEKCQVLVDSENAINELNETNNILESASC